MKLNKKNYYSKEANDYYVSYSQLKSFHECQAKCMAELNGEYEREDTTALLVGSYVDEYLNGSRSFGQFKINNPQIFKKDGTLKADFEQADKIIERIESDKVFRKLLRGRRQVIMTGVIMGVPVKIKIDSLHPDMIVDGKLMKDCEDMWSDEEGSRIPFWRAYHYDWQAFIYQEIVRQNTGKKLPFVLAVATKQKGIDLRTFKFSDETIYNAMIEVGSVIDRLQAVKDGVFAPIRCDNCEYCRSTSITKKGVFELI